MPNITRWIRIFSVAAVTAVLCACSTGNGSAPIVDAAGKHPAEWVDQHWVHFRQTLPTAKIAGKVVAATAADLAKSPCTECHGADLTGGIAKVSCFTVQAQNGQACHATGPVTGSHGWKSDSDHGTSGAKAAPDVSKGFAYCTKCHGSTFDNGAAVSCKSCHTTAPHPPRPWIGAIISHTTTAPANAAECFKCHANGNNFGPVLTSAPTAASPAAPTPDCFNNTLCHGGNVNPPHLKSAAYLAAGQHGIDAAGKNSAKPELSLTTCKACHAGATVRFNLPTNNMASGCETCHAANTAHPTPWLPGRVGTPFNTANATTHASVSTGNMTTACAICHVTTGTAGATPGIPPCMSCHNAASPVTAPTGCTSCHAAFVNQQPSSGAHTKHLALANVACQSCHFGAGATAVNNVAVGTAKHRDGTLDVALLAVDPASNSYLAKTGNFSLNADKTCANVRCHGGKTTPVWTTAGTITVSTDCLKCHEQGTAPQTPQFNSFFSGNILAGINEHQSHLLKTNPGTVRLIFCTDCHNIAALTAQQHFGGLSTFIFEGVPGDTIGGGTTRVTNYVKATGSCTNNCHTLAPNPVNWGL